MRLFLWVVYQCVRVYAYDNHWLVVCMQVRANRLLLNACCIGVCMHDFACACRCVHEGECVSVCVHVTAWKSKSFAFLMSLFPGMFVYYINYIYYFYASIFWNFFLASCGRHKNHRCVSVQGERRHHGHTISLQLQEHGTRHWQAESRGEVSHPFGFLCIVVFICVRVLACEGMCSLR